MISPSLIENRRAIRHLLDDQQAADGMAAFFAFYYADAKTELRPFGLETGKAQGYVCLARTGLDLFRPLVTMRLPIHDLEASADMLYQAIPQNVPIIVNVPQAYGPLLRALMDIESEEPLLLFRLRQTLFEPIVNVLITEDKGSNGLPRFIIRDRQHDNVVVASAGLNWQTAVFSEIAVSTHPQYRRQGYGRSVVAAMANYILAHGRSPLYVVAETNTASIQLAQQVGFMDTGYGQLMIYGRLNGRVATSK